MRHGLTAADTDRPALSSQTAALTYMIPIALTPDEAREDKGAFAWYDTYLISRESSNQCEETHYTLYYLRHGYLLLLFGGLRPGITRSAEKYREKNPGKPVRIYLKANTRYGKDGILYAANTDEDTERVRALISGCERIDVKSGHDIHAEHPDTFVSACDYCWKDRLGNIDARHDIRGFEVAVDDSGRAGSRQCGSS